MLATPVFWHKAEIGGSELMNIGWYCGVPDGELMSSLDAILTHPTTRGYRYKGELL